MMEFTHFSTQCLKVKITLQIQQLELAFLSLILLFQNKIFNNANMGAPLWKCFCAALISGRWPGSMEWESRNLDAKTSSDTDMFCDSGLVTSHPPSVSPPGEQQ